MIGMNRSFFTPMPRILAHRGDSARFPENTLPAFLSAAELGVDVIETDVHLTSDGQIIIWHDDTLDRETDGSGPVEDHTLKELLTLDAGYHFSTDGGQTFPFRGTGIHMLTFEDALQALPHMRFNVDLKTDHTDIAQAFGELVERHQAQDRILCASFHADNLIHVRRKFPDLATSMSRKEVRTLVFMQKLHLPLWRSAVPGIAFQVPEREGRITVITPGFIRRFHRMGIHIQVWTINDAAAMHRLLDMGVDGIFTDDPRVLIAVLKEREPKQL